jgi:hypothetical protein
MSRHLHLVRAARSAGEAFAPPSLEEAPRGRGFMGSLAWLAVGLVAVAGLVAAF